MSEMHGIIFWYTRENNRGLDVSTPPPPHLKGNEVIQNDLIICSLSQIVFGMCMIHVVVSVIVIGFWSDTM